MSRSSITSHLMPVVFAQTQFGEPKGSKPTPAEHDPNMFGNGNKPLDQYSEILKGPKNLKDTINNEREFKNFEIPLLEKFYDLNEMKAIKISTGIFIVYNPVKAKLFISGNFNQNDSLTWIEIAGQVFIEGYRGTFPDEVLYRINLTKELGIPSGQSLADLIAGMHNIEAFCTSDQLTLPYGMKLHFDEEKRKIILKNVPKGYNVYLCNSQVVGSEGQRRLQLIIEKSGTKKEPNKLSETIDLTEEFGIGADQVDDKTGFVVEYLHSFLESKDWYRSRFSTLSTPMKR